MKKGKSSFAFVPAALEKAAKLSKVQRLLICIAAFAAIIGLFVGVIYLPRTEKLDTLAKELEGLETQLTVARNTARQIEKYKEEVRKADLQFKKAARLLPEQKEIPSLLEGISKSGQEAGLEFLLFQPKEEVRQEFYAEIPVAIRVAGAYHNIGVFFDKVSKLFRIVNVRGVKMTPLGKDEAGTLEASCTAVTYRFVEAALEGKPDAKKPKQ